MRLIVPSFSGLSGNITKVSPLLPQPEGEIDASHISCTTYAKFDRFNLQNKQYNSI